MKGRIYSILLSSLLWFNSAQAEIPGLEPASDWLFGGYLKYMVYGSSSDTDDSSSDQLIHNRLDLGYQGHTHWKFNMSLRNRLFWGNSLQNSGIAQLIEQDSGITSLSNNWEDEDSWLLNSRIDRLYFTFKREAWQLRAGRHRINWGMSTIWNPNDLYNTYDLYDFDYEERAGADAVMLTRQFGFASMAELVYAPEGNEQQQSLAARYQFNKHGQDWQLLLGESRGDHVIGAGLSSDLYGAALRGEVSYFDDPSNDDTDNMVATLESDYRFNSGRNWIIRGAVLYQSDPVSILSSEQYLTSASTAKSLSFTQWTGYLELGFDLTALIRLTTSTNYYDDGSYYSGLAASYSLTDNIELLGVLQHFDGRDNDSLFRDSPTTWSYLRLKWSF